MEMSEKIENSFKTSLLKKDLEYFSRDLSSIPLCKNLPSLDSAAHYYGVLYVTEGSTLGGQMIAKAIKSRVVVIDGAGATYFNGYGSRTMLVWAETCKRIEQFAQENEMQRPIVISSAIETFKKLQQWFDEEWGSSDKWFER